MSKVVATTSFNPGVDNDVISTSQKLTTTLLNEFNFLPWSRAITIALGGRSRLGFINGKEKAPDPKSPEYDIWLQKDQMVMSLILNSMERHLAEIFSYSESSFDLWEAVREMYGNQNNSARIFQIQQDIANTHQDGKPFISLYGTVKGLWNELDLYRPLTTDPVVLRKWIEEDQVFQLLASLGPEYEDLRCHVLMNAELPSLKGVCATIQREEIRRKVMTRDTTRNTPNVRAYVAHPSSEKRPYKGKRPDLKCEYCNAIGHSMDRCWSLHPDMKPKFPKDKMGGEKKRVNHHKAHVTAHTGESVSSHLSLLNNFASFLQEMHGQGGNQNGADIQTHNDPSALLSKFAENSQGPYHQEDDW